MLTLYPPDNEQLAKSGMNCLENLVMGAGQSFREVDWDLIIDTITDVYASTLPADMRIWKPTLDTSFDQVSLYVNVRVLKRSINLTSV